MVVGQTSDDMVITGKGDLPQVLLEQIAEIYREKARWTPAQQKLESHLIDLVKEGGTESVLIDIHGQVDDELVGLIEQHDGAVVDARPAYRSLRARVPLGALESIAKLDAVQTIHDGAFTVAATQSQTVSPTTVVSEGDSAHRSDEARQTYGVDGTGISVAVVFDGIRHLEKLQELGALPPHVTVLPGYRGRSGGRAGTLALEVLHDVAPGADLYFAGIDVGVGGYAAAVRSLHEMGVDIIVDGINVFDEPAFQHGTAALAYREVAEKGTLLFISSGNEGNVDSGTAGTWEGDYRAGESVTVGGVSDRAVHYFDADTYANRLTAKSAHGAWLKWSDPDYASSNDYDLFVVSRNGVVVGRSTTWQSGSQRPFERIWNPVLSGYSLVVVKKSGDARYLHLMAYRGRLTHSTPGAVWGPNALPEAFSIAAVENTDSGQPSTSHFSSANKVAGLSSDGPRRIFYDDEGDAITPGSLLAAGGRVINKPDFAGAHRVSTAMPGLSSYPGTSAAAAHVAGIAALMLEAAGGPDNITRDAVEQALRDSAIDIAATGHDRNSGYGIVQALDAVAAVHEVTRNRPPEIVAEPDDLIESADVDLTLDLSRYVSDPDGDELAIAVSLENKRGTITSSLTGTVVTFSGGEGSKARAHVSYEDPGGFTRHLRFGVAFDSAVDTDTSLSALTMTGVDLAGFSPSGRNYAANVPYRTGATTVSATTGNTSATVEILGDDNAPVALTEASTATSTTYEADVALRPGPNRIRILVSATDARTTTYAVTVTRSVPSAAADARLSALTLRDVAVDGFDRDVYEYGATVGSDVTTAVVGATPLQESATVAITPPDADSQAPGHQVDLAEGANEIRVTVTAADETTSSTYVVTVTRAAVPLTGRFVSVPEGHDGTGTVTLRLEFSEPISISYVTLRDESLAVTGGAVRSARRVNKQRDLWDIEVAPASTADLVVTLPATTDCAAAAAVCTAGGKALSQGVEATIPGPAPVVPIVAGILQVGNVLTARFEDTPPATVTYQWLRDGTEIAGATASGHELSVADAGALVSVRVSYDGRKAEAAAEGRIWAAPWNPPVSADEEELLGTLLTVGSTDAYTLPLGGYGRMSKASFGALDATGLRVDGVEHGVTVAALNNVGQFALGTEPEVGDTDGWSVYWDGHRIDRLSLNRSNALWLAEAPPVYERYLHGSSDGVRVALSIRRALPLPVATVSAVGESVDEGSDAVFEVRLDRASGAALEIAVEVAVAGDVVSGEVPSAVLVPAGSTTATLEVSTDDDSVVEEDGSVTVTVLEGTGYTLGEAVAATVAVADDDVAAWTVTAAPAELVEGASATLTVSTGTGVTFATERTLALSVTGEVSESDYALEAGTLDLEAGTDTVTATFEALSDGVEELPEAARLGVALDGTEVASTEMTVRDASTDASLSSLLLTDVAIGEFDAERTAYAATVPAGVSATTVTAEPADANAAVAIADALGSTQGTERTSSLSTGSNEIAATVTAEDVTTSRTYTVAVTRLPAWGTRLPERDIALVGVEATGVWSDGTTLWAAESDGEAAQAYDLATGARRSADDIALTAKRYVTTALWSEDGTLWVANALGEAVAYRLSDGARVASADLDGMLSSAGNGEPVGLWSDGSVLYVVDRADAHLYAYGSDSARLPDREFGLNREERSRAQWGLWSDGETLLTSGNNRHVVAYRLSDGGRLPDRDIELPRTGYGLWSDGETLWVADSLLPRLLAYAVPGLRRTSGTGLLPVVVSNRAAAVPSLDPGPPAHLPDAGLRGRIAVALGKAPEDPVGVNELLALQSLDARGAGIADLTGLEYATNVTALDLSHNPLADLRVLAALPRLSVLNLDGTGAEPWALAGLTGLERLSLRGNGIADVTALAGLHGLRALDLGGNAVVDVSPLSGFAGLRVLSLRGNAVEDVRSLAALPRLLELDVTGNRIGDFGPLAGNALLTVEGREAQAAGISP